MGPSFWDRCANLVSTLVHEVDSIGYTMVHHYLNLIEELSCHVAGQTIHNQHHSRYRLDSVKCKIYRIRSIFIV